MTKSAPSPAYLAAAALLDAGFRGTYGMLGRRIGVHPRAVGSIVRKYARLHTTWNHAFVVSRRTGRPAYF